MIAQSQEQPLNRPGMTVKQRETEAEIERYSETERQRKTDLLSLWFVYLFTFEIGHAKLKLS